MKQLLSVIIITGFCLALILSNWAFKAKDESPLSDSLKIMKAYSSSPVLTARESIARMQVEEGFEVRIVAEEPLVNTPVAMTFDGSNRIWIVEMEGYMPDTVGTGEDRPLGKVVILTDENGDGLMDSRKIFLDSLVLPRAICLIDSGILVAESPRLWYFDIRNDKPVNKELVDSAYADGGNVEHQPNGLFRALDNWIYNAKSDKRYRKVGDRWLIEKTHFRGQWGITQDDQGRLFYNTNSENLLGDLFSPGFAAWNGNQKSVSGFNRKIVGSNRVYPARATTGVNRGYMPGILDDSLRLVNFTAACGPVIYRGNLFGEAYYGNAFVAEPSANLIKRNILGNEGYMIEGRQAYADREFLRSTDERFRPVNLYNGPDGALYIVDMYRGIIQHKTYLTPYLKNEIRERELTQPLTCGRIYKVVPKEKHTTPVVFPRDPLKLATLLQHHNGWVRSKAQQLLVDSGDPRLTSKLRELLKATNDPLSVIHSLWTMEGLGVLSAEDLLPFLENRDWQIRMQALSLSPSVMSKENYNSFLKLFYRLAGSNDTLSAPYIGFLAQSIRKYDPEAAHKLMFDIGRRFANDVFVSDALISNMENEETLFYSQLEKLNRDTGMIINKRLKKVIDDIEKAANSRADPSKDYPRGFAIFRTFCQTCHGADGNGVVSLAPPLNGAEWVTGNINQLSAIVLYGLTGPVQVGNKLYRAPEINGEMPGIASNNEFSDEDVTQLLNYIRNSWTNQAEKVKVEDVAKVRQRFAGRQKAFTVEELMSSIRN